MSEQLAQVEAYCACTDDACKSAASAEMRRLISELMALFVVESKKSDFDPNVPFGDVKTMYAISERVHECGVPQEELRVEMPEEFKAIAKARMAENAEKSRKAGEAEIAAHRAERQSACDGGNGEACYHLALVMERDDSANADPKKVVGYLDRACELGYGGACLTLATAFRGEKDAASLAQAISYYEKGCEKGNASSCNTLALAYEKGPKKSAKFSMVSRPLGLKRNKKKARFFRDRASGLYKLHGKDDGLGPLSDEE